jgi:hypothetical protein
LGGTAIQKRDFSSAQQAERSEQRRLECEVNGLAIIFSQSAKEVDVAPNAKPDDRQEQRVNIKSTVAVAS